MAGIAYTTRERVKRALDSAATSRADAQIDEAIAGATESITGLCHRKFAPEVDTRTWDWPNPQSPTTNRLWLDANELISLDLLTSGGVTIPNADAMLRPDDGPPFTHLETDNSSSSAFAAGATTQRAISITGLFGYRNDERPAGALAEALDATETDVDVTDSAAIGIGSIIRVGSERMIVTGKSMLTTAQTLGGDLTAMANVTLIPVSSGAAFVRDEVVLVDAERMLITDIAGNNLIVKRAWDGSVLAAHTTGATVYAGRRLTVERAALGTTAATHTDTTAIVRWTPPALVGQLAVAEALVNLGCEQAGYATQVRAGDSARSTTLTIDDLRDRVYTAHGRKVRHRAVRR